MDDYKTLGWSGRMDQVTHYLRTVGADRDDDGKFIIGGGGVLTFLGIGGKNADVVIPADAVYFRGGQACGLAAGLRSTSYGLGVHVIA